MKKTPALSRIQVKLPPVLLRRIDRLRGTKKRNRWVVEALAVAAGNERLGEFVETRGRPPTKAR